MPRPFDIRRFDFFRSLIRKCGAYASETKIENNNSPIGQRGFMMGGNGMVAMGVHTSFRLPRDSRTCRLDHVYWSEKNQFKVCQQ